MWCCVEARSCGVLRRGEVPSGRWGVRLCGGLYGGGIPLGAQSGTPPGTPSGGRSRPDGVGWRPLIYLYIHARARETPEMGPRIPPPGPLLGPHLSTPPRLYAIHNRTWCPIPKYAKGKGTPSRHGLREVFTDPLRNPSKRVPF